MIYLSILKTFVNNCLSKKNISLEDINNTAWQNRTHNDPNIVRIIRSMQDMFLENMKERSYNLVVKVKSFSTILKRYEKIPSKFSMEKIFSSSMYKIIYKYKAFD